MPIPVAVYWISLAVSAVAAGNQVVEGKKARESQEKAEDIRQSQQNIDANRTRRQEARKTRVKRAQILQASANRGTSGSSGEAGAIGSLGSRLAEFNAATTSRQRAATDISGNLQDAAGAQFRAGLSGQFSQLTSQFGLSGNI